jgi:hypothetical protein
MGEAEQEKQTPKFGTFPIEWHIPDDLQSRYSNNVLVQSSQNEFVISFFETRLPPFAGNPEDNIAKLEAMGAIRADCVARIIVNPNLFPSIIEAMTTALQQYQEAFGISEKKGIERPNK